MMFGPVAFSPCVFVVFVCVCVCVCVFWFAFWRLWIVAVLLHAC